MVKENDILIPVETKDICKIESAKNYVHIHTASAKYTLRKQLSELSPHLDPAQFIRIDRSLIVNINKIAQIQPLFKGNSTLVLKNNDKIPLGKRNSNRIRDSLDTLNRKKK
jgi:two-component system LytT family response regulator